MNELNRASRTVSYTFFTSQLVATTIYGVASTVVMILAGDSSKGFLITLLIGTVIIAVILFQLPKYFASRFSSFTLSILAIFISILGLVFPIDQARSFIDLPESLITRSSVLHLRTTAYIGVICFSLALATNVIAVFVAKKQTD